MRGESRLGRAPRAGVLTLPPACIGVAASLLLLLCAAQGCARPDAEGAAALTAPRQRQPPPAGAPGAAAGAEQSPAATPDLDAIFRDFRGAFVLYDLRRDRYLRHNEARCRERFTPFSTFKVPNSLIGLESGVIPDADSLVKWDPRKYPRRRGETPPFNAWWQDHTLRTAIRNSVLWYYRELASRVGERRMRESVSQLAYGNRDTSGGVDRFWLNSTLKISADEQVEFLKALYRGQLPVSQRSIAIVKEIITLETTPDYKLSGKTGGGPLGEGRALGWFVGYFETKDNVYFFATQIEGPSYAAIRDPRIDLTKRVLASYGYRPTIPPQQ